MAVVKIKTDIITFIAASPINSELVAGFPRRSNEVFGGFY